MIDWNKPIETVDGREAKFIKEMMTGCIVYVLQQSGCRGDVLLVNDKGYRRDDRASVSERQEPFIRNVRVKREGWVNIYAVHETKEDAEKACADLSRKCARFVRWEE